MAATVLEEICASIFIFEEKREERFKEDMV
jgi:hypothetical protein